MRPVFRKNGTVTSPESTTPEKLSEDTGNPRYIVFGTRIGGAQELTDMMRAELGNRGAIGAEVTMVRNVDAINAAFDGIDPRSRELHQARQLETPRPNKGGLLQKLGELAQRALHLSAVPAEPAQVNIPRGVIILPEMRHYDSGASARNVSTPADRIIALCEERGVPYILAKRIETPHEIGPALLKLLDTDNPPTQSLSSPYLM